MGVFEIRALLFGVFVRGRDCRKLPYGILRSLQKKMAVIVDGKASTGHTPSFVLCSGILLCFWVSLPPPIWKLQHESDPFKMQRPAPKGPLLPGFKHYYTILYYTMISQGDSDEFWTGVGQGYKRGLIWVAVQEVKFNHHI